MSTRRLIILYFGTLLAMFSVAALWEFGLEDRVMRAVNPDHKSETMLKHWEFIIRATFFTAVAMVVPMVSLYRSLKNQQAAEEAQRQSEKNLQAFMDHVPALVSLKDTDGQYLLMNREYTSLFGIDPNDATGKSTRNFFPEELASGFKDQEKQAVMTEQDITREHVVPHTDGEHVHQCTKFPVFKQTGQVYGVGTISTDITALKAAERKVTDALEKTEHANRAKSQFLANMSHELRTPLNSIIGFSQILGLAEFESTRDGRQQEYASDIQKSAEHLLRLINDLLDMSKIEAGQLILREKPVDIADLMKSCCRMLRPQAAVQSVQFDQKVGPGIAGFTVDPRLVTQILVNLLGNAVKYSRPQGTVVVSAELSTDGEVVLSVVDTGSGIPNEDMALVLEPFGQSGASADTAREGTGLGLYLAKEMTELHGGRLNIESVEHKGTQVTVTFPAERTIQPMADIAEA